MDLIHWWQFPNYVYFGKFWPHRVVGAVQSLGPPPLGMPTHSGDAPRDWGIPTFGNAMLLHGSDGALACLCV